MKEIKLCHLLSSTSKHGDGCCYPFDNRANIQPPVMSACPLRSWLPLASLAPSRTKAGCNQLMAKLWHSVSDGHNSSWIFPWSSVLTTASCCQELIGSVNSIPFAMTIWWNATSNRVWRNSKSLKECLLVCFWQIHCATSGPDFNLTNSFYFWFASVKYYINYTSMQHAGLLLHVRCLETGLSAVHFQVTSTYMNTRFTWQWDKSVGKRWPLGWLTAVNTAAVLVSSSKWRAHSVSLALSFPWFYTSSETLTLSVCDAQHLGKVLVCPRVYEAFNHLAALFNSLLFLSPWCSHWPTDNKQWHLVAKKSFELALFVMMHWATLNGPTKMILKKLFCKRGSPGVKESLKTITSHLGRWVTWPMRSEGVIVVSASRGSGGIWIVQCIKGEVLCCLPTSLQFISATSGNVLVSCSQKVSARQLFARASTPILPFMKSTAIQEHDDELNKSVVSVFSTTFQPSFFFSSWTLWN